MLNQYACYVTLERAAVQEVLGAWSQASQGVGVLALVAEGDKAGIPLLQQVAGTLGISLVGAVFPALIRERQFVQRGVWLLRLDHMPPAFLLADLGPSSAQPLAPLVTEVEQVLAVQPTDGEPPTLFMIFDAMVPNIGPLLDDLYLQLADGVAYAGVNAGSETFQPMACLFDGQRVVNNGLLALLLPPGQRPLLQHDYPMPTRAMCATSAEGNCVKSIDWRPAFEVYQELVAREYGIQLTRENFYEHACHFPLGILRANQEVIVRIPVGLRDDGSVFCVGDVPANSVLALLQAPQPDRGALQKLLDSLARGPSSLAGRPLLTFYCAGRRMHMGDLARKELAGQTELSGCSELAGALSLGEIGSAHAWEYPLFHNAALVCVPWGNK